MNSSSQNQEIRNRLSPEVLISSSEDSSNFSHDKLKEVSQSRDNVATNRNKRFENHSHQRSYLNEHNSQESDGNEPPLNRLCLDNSGRENESGLSDHNDTSENDNSNLGNIVNSGNNNSTSECTNASRNKNCCEHLSVTRNDTSTAEKIDCSGNENSRSMHTDTIENNKSTSKPIEETKSEKSKSKDSGLCVTEIKISEINLCEDDSNLSEERSNENKTKINEKKQPITDLGSDSLQTEKIVKSFQKNLVVVSHEPRGCDNDINDLMEVDGPTNNVDSNLTENKNSSDIAKQIHSNINHELSMKDNLNTEGNASKLNEKSESFGSSKANRKEVSIKSKKQVNGEITEQLGNKTSLRLASDAALLKIGLVNSLDVFIDEGATGSPAPATDSPAANPLETDHEDTNDTVGDEDENQNADSDDVLIINDSSNDNANEVDEATNDGSGMHPEAGNKIRYLKVSDKLLSKKAKDVNEPTEVITGDKTVPNDYVTKTLELMGEGSTLALNDHGYSKQGTPQTEGKESKVTRSPKTLKVIYPKRKDANQLDIHIMPVPVLKHCLHCAKLAKCCIRIEVGGCECHLCSEECLEQHKTLQSNTLRRTSLQSEIAQENVLETRLCVECNSDVSIQSEEKILSWETMEFCNEDCLGKYQSKMWHCCAGCSKEVPTSSMGKYCVRFGHEIKQFCSSSCLEDFKKGIKACSYCQKDLSTSDEGFLAPIADKTQFRDFCSQNCLDEYDCMSRNLPAGGLKVESCGVCDKTQLVQVQVITTPGTVNLCSEVCFKAFKFVNKSISHTPCYMCKKYFETNLKNKVTVYYENEILSFCSKTCMNINILAKRRIVACNWCKVKKYNFDMIRRKTSSIVTNWCSLNCMALYQVSMNAVNIRSKSNCALCHKYGLPSLHLAMSDATIRNFCSHECVDKFKANFKGQTGNGVFPTGKPKRILRTKALYPTKGEKNATFSDAITKNISGSKVKTKNTVSSVGSTVLQKNEEKCSSAPKTSVGSTFSNFLTLQSLSPDVKNAKVQVYCNTSNKAVTAKPSQTTRSIQTDTIEEKGTVLVPIPVPIFVPVPMAMYSVPVPTPFPFPIPIPVPIVIPTTRGTAEEIFSDIKKIQDKMPGNPFEAELLMMAEMAEGQKKSTESEAINITDNDGDETRRGQKRSVIETESNDGPPGKKKKEDVRDNVLDNTVHHLSTSRLSMSLKETLGVSAWKHYASQSGDRLDLLEMRPGELAQALKRFIQNARILGEREYTPDQKYYLMLGIQYYLEESGRIDNIFFDKLFDPFIDALNEEAKKFQKTFANSDNVITRVEEEHLWESKQLGPHSPATLLATLIYFNTKYFNLTTVEEHMQLSFSHIMKHWKRNPNAAPPPSNNSKSSNGSRNVLLRFYPPQSSLDAPNSKKKKVYEQEANEADPYRCPVQIYEFYLSKCPESMKSRNDMFYLNPERSCVPDSPIWFSTLPVDPDVLERVLNRFKMVKEINIALLADV